MNKIFLALAVLSMGLFSSCDKCKDADCKNGATCEKKVGDCNCAAFYEGSKCDTETRTRYNHNYTGTLEIPPSFPTMPTIIAITSDGTVASAQNYKIVVTTGQNSSTTIDIKGNLTSTTAFEIVRTKVPFSLVPGETEAFVSGTGVFAGDSCTADITIQLALSGTAFTAKYAGAK